MKKPTGKGVQMERNDIYNEWDEIDEQDEFQEEDEWLDPAFYSESQVNGMFYNNYL